MVVEQNYGHIKVLATKTFLGKCNTLPLNFFFHPYAYVFNQCEIIFSSSIVHNDDK